MVLGAPRTASFAGEKKSSCQTANDPMTAECKRLLSHELESYIYFIQDG